MDETDAVDIDAAQSLSADRDAGRDADRATGGDAGRATERVAGAAVGQDAADQAEDQADTPDLAGADPAGQAADLAPATLVAAVVVDELCRAGVTDAVVCPGSRSAALALALAEADRTGRLRLHVRTDERTASFLALGLARRSGRPVPVVMTSGTAVANCLPAMVEATASGVPLMIFSADRPWSYQGTGANQTIAQAGIFGVHAVVAATLDAAVRSADPDHREVRATVDRVVDAALDRNGAGVRAGGVQLDIPFTEPMVPGTAAEVSLAAEVAAASGGTDGDGTPVAWSTGWPLVGPAAPSTPDTPTVTVDLSRRTLVIVGDVRDRPWARRVLDVLADVPTIAEPTAPAPATPVHPAAAGLLTGEVTGGGEDGTAATVVRTRPEQIVLVGRPTLHRSISRLLADPAVDIVALTDRDPVTDVAHTVRRRGRGVRVTGELPADWLKICAAASEVAVEAVRDTVASDDFTGLHTAAAVTDALRDGDALVLGASSAVRDASLCGLPFPGVWTVSNRGAAGIDGTVSTAVGVALAHASTDPTAVRAPRTVALMGDLTFLHDAGGLNIGPGEPRPENLVIVVSNDDGGAIFETLEAGRPALRTFDDGRPVFDRVFGTPTGADLGALCEAYGVAHRQVGSLADLSTALDEHAEGATEGFLVIEAAVDRQVRAGLHGALTRRTTVG